MYIQIYRHDLSCFPMANLARRGADFGPVAVVAPIPADLSIFALAAATGDRKRGYVPLHLKKHRNMEI